MDDPKTEPDPQIFDKLFEVIARRKGASADESYTASLMAAGSEKISAKMREELQEFIDSVQTGSNRDHQTHEICDLLYHSFVMAVFAGLTLDDIRGELTRRFGTSGHAEKASRKNSR